VCKKRFKFFNFYSKKRFVRMVRGQYTSRKRMLRMDSAARDIYLQRCLGITQHDLQGIWGIADAEERLIAGARLLYEKTGDHISLTVHNLAAAVEPKWNATGALNRASRSIEKVVEARKSSLDPRLLQQYSITNMQILREVAGLSNQSEVVVKTAEKWPSFKYGERDWLRGTCIPTEIGYEQALLLGIIWGDGLVDRYPSYLLLQGRRQDFPFYKYVIKELIENVYNLPVKLGKGIKPVIRIGSTAVVTWLINDLGFPNTYRKTDVKLPGIEWTRENERAFFSGIVASMGNPHQGAMITRDKDYSFIREIKKLSERLDFTPVMNTTKSATKSLEPYTSYYLYYSPSEVKQMSLINPRHVRK